MLTGSGAAWGQGHLGGGMCLSGHTVSGSLALGVLR